MPGKTWDPFKTYDVTPEESAAMAERSQMRAALKAEFQKKVTNPHRGVHGFLVSDLHNNNKHGDTDTYLCQMKGP